MLKEQNIDIKKKKLCKYWERQQKYPGQWREYNAEIEDRT